MLGALSGMGPGRLLAMLGVGASLIGLFIFLTLRISAPSMSLLYGDLAISDSSEIVSRLETQSIPFEIRANGTQVYVPEDQVLRLRLAMAQEGVPAGGSVGYEIFDEGPSTWDHQFRSEHQSGSAPSRANFPERSGRSTRSKASGCIWCSRNVSSSLATSASRAPLSSFR